ncbi:MAG: hypothetical protein ACLPI9_02105 [Halobacteriota archaeon]
MDRQTRTGLKSAKKNDPQLDKRMAIVNAVISAEHGFVKQRDGLR